MLESLYKLEDVKRNAFYAFVLGFAYSTIGVGIGFILFNEDPALIAVAFAALLMAPTLRKMLQQQEHVQAESVLESKFDHVRRISRHSGSLIKVYIAYFLGVLIVFSIFTLLLPPLKANYLFKNQLCAKSSTLEAQQDCLGSAYGLGNAARFSNFLFHSLLTHNFVVMLLAFVTAFVLGEGGVFLITWNASVWGTIFGSVATSAALHTGKNAFILFILVLIAVFPHMILEALAYVVAAIAGGSASVGATSEKLLSIPFRRVLFTTLLFLVIAVVIVVGAAALETYVLQNQEVYRIIIQQSLR